MHADRQFIRMALMEINVTWFEFESEWFDFESKWFDFESKWFDFETKWFKRLRFPIAIEANLNLQSTFSSLKLICGDLHWIHFVKFLWISSFFSVHLLHTRSMIYLWPSQDHPRSKQYLFQLNEWRSFQQFYDFWQLFLFSLDFFTFSHFFRTVFVICRLLSHFVQLFRWLWTSFPFDFINFVQLFRLFPATSEYFQIFAHFSTFLVHFLTVFLEPRTLTLCVFLATISWWCLILSKINLCHEKDI